MNYRTLEPILQPLYRAALDGGKDERNRLIEAAYPLAKFEAGRFVKRNYDARHIADDIESAAAFGLVCAADWLIKKRLPCAIAAFFGKSIRHEMSGAICANLSIFSGHKDTVRRHRLRNIEMPATVELFADEQTTGRDASALRANILDCCESTAERDYVSLRADGYTDKELTGRLGIGRQSLTRMKQRIEHRFNESLALGA